MGRSEGGGEEEEAEPKSFSRRMGGLFLCDSQSVLEPQRGGWGGPSDWGFTFKWQSRKTPLLVGVCVCVCGPGPHIAALHFPVILATEGRSWAAALVSSQPDTFRHGWTTGKLSNSEQERLPRPAPPSCRRSAFE